MSSSVFSLRLEPELLKKVRILAAGNKRSLNKEIAYLISQYIDAYEKEHGEITVPKE